MSNNSQILYSLVDVIRNNKTKLPEESYTAELFNKGKEKIANKLGEEAVETITAFLSQSKKDVVNETADLIYHLFILLEFSDISINEVLNVLEKRMDDKK